MDEKKKAKVNSVRVVGYLKENNLEKITNSRGDDVIRGSLIISTDKISSHKVQFYVSSKTASGADSKDYASLEELLPVNTITIASFLKDNPDADFDGAANAASKVWVMGRLDEYATRTGERTTSMVTIKGFRGGFSKIEKAPFTPHAEFDIDIYIKEMTPEKDESGVETGRILIEGAVPKYNKTGPLVDVIDFVAVKEDSVAKYVAANYAVGDTVNIKGDLISLYERRVVENSDDSEYFGRVMAPQYETTFIRERRIAGGSRVPLHQGDEECITTEFVKEGLAERENKMVENGQRMREKAEWSTADSVPFTQKNTEIDF